ncbi:DcaP family trimeric outer membrane transporter [Dyella tabacisoli]|nr:DcaP family trimeric outer membrane transporter [Dyella tabacisoli]
MAISVACALTLPLAAQAQDNSREQKLEQRVAQLEQQLAELKGLIQSSATQSGAAQSSAAQSGAAQPQKATPAGVPAQTITAAKPGDHEVVLTTPGNAYGQTKVKVGGWIRAEALSTHTNGYLGDQAAARDLYLPGSTPIGGKSANYSDMHAKFSRFNIGVDSLTDNGDKVGGFFEWDFFGNSLGNENATNTYGLTLRHAYVYWNNWLAGQTWTNFMDPNALPEAVDFIGPTDGTVFVRQAQLRYTTGDFSVALENPHTTLTPYHGGSTQISPDHNTVPDLTARYTWKGDWGFIGIAGLVRQLRMDGSNDKPVTAKSSATGIGGSVMGKWNVSSHDDIRYAATYGKGIGRYIGLANITADGALNANGSIESRKLWAAYVSWRHAFNEKLRSNVMFARNGLDNDVTLTGLAANKYTESVHFNLIYSPMPKLDIGAEYTWARRALESGDYGKLQRLQFMAKYAF